MRVRVVGVSRAIDTETGGPIWIINFGRIIGITDDIRARMQAGGQTPPAIAEIGINSLVLIHRFEGPVPYLLDSEWDLDVADDGSISVRSAADGH